MLHVHIHLDYGVYQQNLITNLLLLFLLLRNLYRRSMSYETAVETQIYLPLFTMTFFCDL